MSSDLVNMSHFNSGNDWGMRSEKDKLKEELAALMKARQKADDRQKKIIDQKIKMLEKDQEGLARVIEARIQLYVYQKKAKCPAMKKYHGAYLSKCKELKRLAKL